MSTVLFALNKDRLDQIIQDNKGCIERIVPSRAGFYILVRASTCNSPDMMTDLLFVQIPFTCKEWENIIGSQSQTHYLGMLLKLAGFELIIQDVKIESGLYDNHTLLWLRVIILKTEQIPRELISNRSFQLSPSLVLKPACRYIIIWNINECMDGLQIEISQLINNMQTIMQCAVGNSKGDIVVIIDFKQFTIHIRDALLKENITILSSKQEIGILARYDKICYIGVYPPKWISPCTTIDVHIQSPSGNTNIVVNPYSITTVLSWHVLSSVHIPEISNIFPYIPRHMDIYESLIKFVQPNLPIQFILLEKKMKYYCLKYKYPSFDVLLSHCNCETIRVVGEFVYHVYTMELKIHAIVYSLYMKLYIKYLGIHTLFISWIDLHTIHVSSICKVEVEKYYNILEFSIHEMARNTVEIVVPCIKIHKIEQIIDDCLLNQIQNVCGIAIRILFVKNNVPYPRDKLQLQSEVDVIFQICAPVKNKVRCAYNMLRKCIIRLNPEGKYIHTRSLHFF
jgi:hypothetical protein